MSYFTLRRYPILYASYPTADFIANERHNPESHATSYVQDYTHHAHHGNSYNNPYAHDDLTAAHHTAAPATYSCGMTSYAEPQEAKWYCHICLDTGDAAGPYVVALYGRCETCEHEPCPRCPRVTQ